MASDVGARIRALRQARGLTQSQVAEPAYTKAYISMLEAGRTRASMKALEHIGARLGVQPADLLAERPPAGPQYERMLAAVDELMEVTRSAATHAAAAARGRGDRRAAERHARRSLELLAVAAARRAELATLDGSPDALRRASEALRLARQALQALRDR